MGKFVLAVVAVLALCPLAVAGRGVPLSPTVQRELDREERCFQEEFLELEESYNNCNFQSEEEYTEFNDDLDSINSRRRWAYMTRNQWVPPDFYCEGEGNPE